MKISIVIPAHNEERYIGRTLQTILEMEYPDFEVIVVDNASTDATASIARSFPGVQVVHEPQKGTQFARERGRRLAKGELIASIDADCLPKKDWLKNGATFFTDSGTVYVSGPYDYFDSSHVMRRVSFLFQTVVYVPIHFVLTKFGLGGVMIAGNSMLRASSLENIGGYDTSYVFYGDDTDTAKRLSQVGKGVFTSTFTMKSSARRLQRQGIFNTLGKYIYHFLKVIFRGEKK